ncbi:hypothetical protein BPAE_0502g00050 [Botrytis paeoniae]|uniref:Uncharacterized protein n=1 Tax=Botrytis paeoniae TaxID=278948 RepID=A0A4Z1EXR8_9HELO|nr:hypothetical protein BPAE_0502g00050 [Botrytis paeoniae]
MDYEVVGDHRVILQLKVLWQNKEVQKLKQYLFYRFHYWLRPRLLVGQPVSNPKIPQKDDYTYMINESTHVALDCFPIIEASFLHNFTLGGAVNFSLGSWERMP